MNNLTRYDFTEAEKWLKCYSAKEMAEMLKDNAMNLVSMGLGQSDGIDPKEHVLHMMEAVNFVCDFLNTIETEELREPTVTL